MTACKIADSKEKLHQEMCDTFVTKLLQT